MGEYYIPLLILLITLAVFIQDDFIFTLIYLLAGAYAFLRLWGQYALRSVKHSRSFTDRAFPEDRVEVKVRLNNSGLAPIVWMLVSEAVHVNLRGTGGFRRVVTLGPRGMTEFSYQLRPKSRGFYPVGPLFIRSGDILGIGGELAAQGESDHLIVYPRVVPISNIGLPSWSPMGTLGHRFPMFEDPTRIRGKRPYIPGDPLRSVDWKSSAVSGELQVKLLEPSIALNVGIFLNLNRDEFRQRRRSEAVELAIVVAASVANWVSVHKQPVGLAVNGTDPLAGSAVSHSLSPKRGAAHLMGILEVLARIQFVEAHPFADFFREERIQLPWGSTILLITNTVDDDLFDQILFARSDGLHPTVILCGQVFGLSEIRARSLAVGVPVLHLLSEQDLDSWR